MKIGIGPYYIKEYGVAEGAKRMHRHGYEYLDFGFYSKTDNGLYPADEAEFIRVVDDEIRHEKHGQKYIHKEQI